MDHLVHRISRAAFMFHVRAAFLFALDALGWAENERER
jgi:hypothetical protein